MCVRAYNAEIDSKHRRSPLHLPRRCNLPPLPKQHPYLPVGTVTFRYLISRSTYLPADLPPNRTDKARASSRRVGLITQVNCVSIAPNTGERTAESYLWSQAFEPLEGSDFSRGSTVNSCAFDLFTSANLAGRQAHSPAQLRNLSTMKALLSVIFGCVVCISSVNAGPVRTARHVANHTAMTAKNVAHSTVKGTRRAVHTVAGFFTP